MLMTPKRKVDPFAQPLCASRVLHYYLQRAASALDLAMHHTDLILSLLPVSSTRTHLTLRTYFIHTRSLYRSPYSYVCFFTRKATTTKTTKWRGLDKYVVKSSLHPGSTLLLYYTTCGLLLKNSIRMILITKLLKELVE